VIVHPIPVIASVEHELASHLCSQDSSCGTRAWHYEVPPHGRRSGYTQTVYVGTKQIPGLQSDALAGDFSGVLRGFKNIKEIYLTAPESRGRSRQSQPTYAISAAVTEIAWHGERSVDGMGSTIVGNLLIIPNLIKSRVANSLGYARIDVKVTDVSTGEIIAAFPAAGTYRGEYLTDSAFQFNSDIPKGFGALMIRSAVHLAFQDATIRLAERLSKRGA
jgi:hypothetical protein